MDTQNGVFSIIKYREARAEAFVGSGYLKSEDKATRELEKHIKDLQEENEILKKLWVSLQKARGDSSLLKKHQQVYRDSNMCQVLDVSTSGYYA